MTILTTNKTRSAAKKLARKPIKPAATRARTPIKQAEKPRYSRPRVVQSWSRPKRAYVSCLATAAFDDGKRGRELVEAVERIVPEWKSFFEVPPTDIALIGRAHNSRLMPSEAPEVSKYNKGIWPVAQRDYANRSSSYCT
jgi:hypothetical protein